ncbi:MAG: histidinol-phosphate transaminase [Oceanospirillaceae bacterium]|nr:histidinol-phosphate transaminase [Oceanospirillaceae bacterium]
MSCDFLALASEGIRGLSPYQPGKPIDELARELGIEPESIVKLASNENPLGPSEKVLQAISKALPEITRYPDGNGFILKDALCKQFGIQPNQITLGNGSSDILEFVVKCFASAGDEVIYSQHAFAIYGLVTRMVNAVSVVTPAKNFAHDLDAMANAVTAKTKIIFVTNPNNPTGTWIKKDELLAFLNKVPKSVVVVLDEAYFEYVNEKEYPDGISLVAQFPNLVVARTFSKAYGLAALRVGYAVSNAQIAVILNRVRPPFNVNSLALVAAAAALQDRYYVRQSVELNAFGMKQIIQGFEELNIRYIPSVGNFIAFEVPEAGKVFQDLLQKGVIVRPIANYEMPGYLRVSIGTQAENMRFLVALKEVLASHG